MEDLGDVKENFVEFFRCIEKPSTEVSAPNAPFPPSTHGNLLASSSRYGYLFVASGSKIISYALSGLREQEESSAVHSVDLEQLKVSQVQSVALLLDEEVLAVHASSTSQSPSQVFLLSVFALARGDLVQFRRPSFIAEPKCVAVAPQDYEVGSRVESNCMAVLLANGAVEVYRVSRNTRPILATRTRTPETPVCMALCPGDELLAVGTKRGSVLIYDAETTTLRTTIKEVESGWVPLALHFVTDDSVLVSYASDEMVSHVMWTLGEEEGVLRVSGHSALGELCFASLPSLPPSEDSENEDDRQSTARGFHPVISCCRIPGWDVCVVASSMSTDVEVIAINDDGEWENWKFDEGKSATLPTDADDNDTKAIGIALDMNDTNFIESADPSVPRINPMPRLITYSTNFSLLPFSLIDDRRNASNEFVHKPSELPPPPSKNLIEDTDSALQSFADKEPTRSPIEPKSTFSGSQTMSSFDYKQPSVAGNTFADRAKAAPDIKWSGAGNSFVLPPSDKGGFLSTMSTSGTVNPFGTLQVQPDLESSEDSESGEGVEDVSDADVSDEGINQGDETSEASDTRINAFSSFSGTEGFLSNFSFTSHAQTGDSVIAAKTDNRGDFAVGNNVGSGATKSTQRVGGHSSKPPYRLPAPAYPPQPSLIESSAVVDSGEPTDLVKSILLEMREELDYNKNAQEAVTKQLQAAENVITPQIRRTKDELQKTLREIREHYRSESSLRNELLDAMKALMNLSRDYEAVSLDFRIREEEGMATTLMAEDKAKDEMLAKREAEVVKSMASIEEKLSSERMPRDRRASPTEQIQQIFSSLSLQGIRIKKVTALLKALSERVQELDKGGRRSDLGLSMARLEMLSISEKKSNDQEIQTNAIASNNNRGPRDELCISGNSKMIVQQEEEDIASKEVRSVLRRLAMRGGRANISAKRTRTAGQNVSAVNVEQIGKSSERKQTECSVEATRPDTVETPAIESLSMSRSTRPPTSANKRKSQLHQETPSQLAATTSQGLQSHAFKLVGRSADLTRESSGIPQFRKGSPEDDNPLPPVTRRNPSVLGEKLLSKRPPTAFLPPDDSFGLLKQATPTAGDAITGKEAFEKKSSPFAALTSFGTQQSNAEQVTEKRKPPTSTVFALPPDESKEKPSRSTAFAHLPPDEPKQKPSTSPEFASLPPDDSEKNSEKAEFASLPPDDSKKKLPLPKGDFAPLPPDESLTQGIPKVVSTAGQGNAEPQGQTPISKPLSTSSVSTGLQSKGTLREKSNSGMFAALPPDPEPVKAKSISTAVPKEIQKESSTESAESATRTSLFAALPPDNYQVSSEANKSSGEESLKRDSTSKFVSDAKHGLFSENKERTDSGSSLNAFSLSRSAGMPTFGSKPVASSESSPAFGTSLNFNLNSSSAASFGSAAVGKSQENEVPSNRPVSPNGSSTDDSEKEKLGGFGGSFGMDTTTTSAESSNPFKTAWPAPSSSQSFGTFGSQSQNAQSTTTSSLFGQGVAGFGSSSPNPQPFGNSGAQPSPASGFGASTPQTGFGAATPQGPPSNPFSSFGASSFQSPVTGFGSQSSFQTGPQFGASSPIGSAQFGSPSQLGGGAQFGASSQLGAGFGESSKIGGGTPFGAAGGFGSNTPASSFGQSGFAQGQSQPSFGSGGNAFGANAAPFGSVAPSGFGGQGGGGSGFAALAGSNSGFGNGGAPIFGDNNGPPSFTSAAFAQRRA